jgi:hypothetical protein
MTNLQLLTWVASPWIVVAFCYVIYRVADRSRA